MSSIATFAARRPSINIAGIEIRQDEAGRYCLNDFHKAAGGEERHGPAKFMRLGTTDELANAIAESAGGNWTDVSSIPVWSVREGRNGGTYVVKELVYAYAMWISPAFHLKVIRAYDEMVTRPVPVEPEPPLVVMARAVLPAPAALWRTRRWPPRPSACGAWRRTTSRQEKSPRGIRLEGLIHAPTSCTHGVRKYLILLGSM